MACGCPVVTYRNASLPEVAGDAAVLVADGDADAMGRAAPEIALNPELAGQAAQSRSGPRQTVLMAKGRVSHDRGLCAGDVIVDLSQANAFWPVGAARQPVVEAPAPP